jgi:hypothetical protein
MVKRNALLLLCGLVLPSPARSAPAVPPTLAVLDLAFSPADEELASAAAESLSAELMASGKFTLVERRRIASAIREQALAQSGVVSDESAIKVGAVLGAKLLVVGRLSRLGGLNRLDARLLNSETGQIVAAAHADFKEPANLDLAARDVVGQLTSAGTAPSASAAAGKTPIVAPDTALDPVKMRQAAAEIAQQIGRRFQVIHSHLDSVDEGGRATFHTNGAFVFRGLHISISGVDSMSGDRELKGYMLVDSTDSGIASGRTTSKTEPCAGGDDAIGLPFTARVHGPLLDAVRELASALYGLPQFDRDAPDATPLNVQFDVSGSAIGDRHLRVRVQDKDANDLATFEGTVSF